MSDRDQEIIGSLRRIFEAFNRADFDAAMEIAHPEVEFVPPGGQSPLRGADALRAWMEPDAFEEQRIEPVEFRIRGNKILVRLDTRARGARSGIELELDMWVVWTVNDDGLVTRLESFLIHEESQALEAAGLEE
jgi:ketosteroid isomerase-like protein